MALVASNASSPLVENGPSFLPLTATTLAKVEPFPIRGKCVSGMSDISTACSSLDDIFSRTAASGLEGGKPCWTKAKVLKLGTELLEGYSNPIFQEKLQALVANAPNQREVPGRMELAHSVQANVLPKYGLDATPEGVDEMVKTIAPFMVDWMVERLVTDIEKKLGLPANSTMDMAWLPSRAEVPVVEEKVTSVRPEVKRAEEQCTNQNLTREQVLALATELLDGFRASDFQAALQKLLKECSKAELRLRRTELALTVQGKVLPKYGFAGTTLGVMEMLEALAPFADDWMVARLVSDIDEKLGLPAETTLTTLYSFSA